MRQFYILLSIAFIVAASIFAIAASANAQVHGHDWPVELKPVAPGVAVPPTNGGGGNQPPYTYTPPDFPVVEGRPYQVCITDNNGQINCTTYIGHKGKLVLPTPDPTLIDAESVNITKTNTIKDDNIKS